MNGDSLITRVRRVLKDEATNVAQGNFWSDREIILAINAAQSIFIKHALELELHYLLAQLVRKTVYSTSATNYVFSPECFSYISAQVGDIDNLKPARIYMGGDGMYYENTHHKAVILIGKDVYFIDGAYTDPKNGWGVLHYYTYPSYIGATSLGDNPSAPIPPIVPKTDWYSIDFEDWVYNDVIANHAAVICGLKETTNQRDFKKYKRVMGEMMMNPGIYANHILEAEFTGIKNKVGRPKEVQGEQQNA